MLGVDVGQMILLGTIVSIPMLIVVMFYVKYIGKKIYQIPNPNGGFDRKEYKAEYIKSMDQVEKLIDAKTLPSFGASIAPIIALVIGTLLAIYGLVKDRDNKEVLGMMDGAIKDTGIIMLITGAGGALGNVIKVAGIGDVLGTAITKTPLPAILIPFIIAALMRIALGSATVAITTAASLSAGLIGMLNVSPLLMAISCCVGAISFSYFNDSGFWVFNGMFGLTELKDQVRCKTAVSLIMAGVGIVELFILGIFIH